jgi:hypothetical protein
VYAAAPFIIIFQPLLLPSVLIFILITLAYTRVLQGALVKIKNKNKQKKR